MDAGVDFFDCSLRRFWEPAFDGSDLNLSGWTKKITGRSTMTVGSVGLASAFVPSLEAIGAPSATADVSVLLRLFERGDFDLVGVGRALIADPDWAKKLRQGRHDQVRSYDAAALQQLR